MKLAAAVAVLLAALLAWALAGANEAVLGWYYSATGDYETVYTRGPFSSERRCLAHEARNVPSWWESTGCLLRSIDLDTEEDYSAIGREA